MASFIRETVLLRVFGFFKIPLIFFLRPSIIEISDQRAVIKMPLSYRSKNHLGSMYFGALCTGADCAGGIMAMRLIKDYGKRASMVFKSFQVDFLKRATSDVHYICEDGALIAKFVQKALESGERENMPVHVTAIAPKTSGNEPVARFTLMLSLKIKSA